MSKPVLSPANYIPQFAMSFANTDGTAALVNATAPLPVTVTSSTAVQAVNGAVAITLPTTTPLVGTASASTTLGPYAPVVGRSVILTLSGTWSGSVQVLRSIDNGVTKVPLTVGGATWALFTVNCCEAIWDESEATGKLYLQVTLSSGTLNYRMAQ